MTLCYVQSTEGQTLSDAPSVFLIVKNKSPNFCLHTHFLLKPDVLTTGGYISSGWTSSCLCSHSLTHKTSRLVVETVSLTLLPSTDSDVGMTTVNRCLDAAKACNVDDLCQKLRTEYVSACIKPTAKSGLCNRPKCNKALRRFFDRVPADYTHELLFCPCTDTACAERRRQTIVPSCSYETVDKPNCIAQMRICKADYVCR